MTAILFGSIGTLAETSELQREAFNAAFAEHGLDWSWSQPEYRRMLAQSGGRKRIAAYAAERGESVDAAAVHATKSAIFQRRLREQGATPREDVVATIAAARAEGVRLALVTTTTPENIAALAEALSPQVDLGDFALVLDVNAVEHPKPAGDVYRLVLEALGEAPEDVIAIEDNAGGVQAAAAAGLACLAFPGANNADHDFSLAERTIDRLTPGDLPQLAASR